MAALARSIPTLVLCLALTLVNAIPVAPYLARTGALGSPNDGDEVRLRVLTFNLHGRSTDTEALRSFIDREQPDIILLSEAPSGIDFLQDIAGRYPYRITEQQGVPLDVVLISRWRIQDWSADRSVAQFRSVLKAQLCPPDSIGRCLTFIGLHADQPFGDGARRQQMQLDIAAREIEDRTGSDPILLMGDLNMAPWSRRFRAFVGRTGLRDTSTARHLSATWSSRCPLLGLPIDHILIGSSFEVRKNWIGEDLGSDHFPVLAELAFKPR